MGLGRSVPCFEALQSPRHLKGISLTPAAVRMAVGGDQADEGNGDHTGKDLHVDGHIQQLVSFPEPSCHFHCSDDWNDVIGGKLSEVSAWVLQQEGEE